MTEIKFIKLTPQILENLLERELMAQFFQHMTKQDNPYTNGEKLVTIGSAITLMEGAHNIELAPHRRIASDMDFYIHEPHGEVITLKNKQELVNTTKKLFTKTAMEMGGSLGDSDGEYPGNHTYSLSRTFSPEEIQAMMERPDIQKLLERVYNLPNVKFGVSENLPPQGVHVSSPVHLLAYPMSFLPPQPFDPAPSQPGKVEILADDTLNTIAIKLARLMKPPPQNSYNMMVEKTSDMIDIDDILKIREKKGAAPLDMDLLKVLTLAHLSYLTPPGELNKMSAMRVCPDADCELDITARIGRCKNHLDQLALQMTRTRHIQVRTDNEEQWAAFRKSPPYRTAEAIIRTTDGLMKQLFPNRSAEDRLGLTDAEAAFVTGLRPELSQRNYGADEKAAVPVKAIENLAADFPAVFANHPELRNGLIQSWSLRPMDHVIENQRGSPGERRQNGHIV